MIKGEFKKMLKTSRMNLKIKNGLTNDCNILLSSGHYKPLIHITPADYLINKDGKLVKVKEIRYAGKKQLMTINSEAWHLPIIISEDQKIITNSDRIILPSSKNIQWTGITYNDAITYNFEFGFVLGLLVASGMVSEKNVVLLIKTESFVSSIKQLNRCLSSVICIKDIEILEGKCLIKYIIEKNSIPHCILDILKTKHIPDDIYNPFRIEYINGIKEGLSFAVRFTDRLDKSFDNINSLCNWINLVFPTTDETKQIKYYVEKTDMFDRVWNIILEKQEETFITNNLVCVSSHIEQK